MESGRCLFMQSGIIGFGTRNTTQGIRNPIKECNPESQVPLTIFSMQYLELEIHGVESRDSKTVLDTLTWDDSK